MNETRDERWVRLRRTRRESDPSGELVDRAVGRMRSLTDEGVARSLRDAEEIRRLAVEAVKPEAEVEQSSRRTAVPRHSNVIGVVAVLAGLIAPAMLGTTSRSHEPFFPSEIAIVVTGALVGVSALFLLVLAIRKPTRRLFTSPIYGALVIVWMVGVVGTVGRAAGMFETVERPVDGRFLLLPHVAGSLLVQVAAIATVGWLWARARRMQRDDRSRSDLSESDALTGEQRAAALAAEIEGIRLWTRSGGPSDEAVSAALASAFDHWAYGVR